MRNLTLSIDGIRIVLKKLDGKPGIAHVRCQLLGVELILAVTRSEATLHEGVIPSEAEKIMDRLKMNVVNRMPPLERKHQTDNIL